MPRAAKTKHAQHSDEDDYDGNDDEIFTLPVEDAERIAKKIENLPTLEKLLKEEDPNAVSMDELNSVANFVAELIALQPTNDDDVGRCLRQLQKRHRCVYKKSLLLAGYKHLLAQRRATTLNASPSSSPPITATTAHGGNHDLEDFATPSPTLQHPLHERCLVLERHLVSKAPRSQSGVLVVTVFTSPYPHGQRFTCKWNCYYCPNEPGQPRSYLLNEPGVRRANRLNFDAYEQFVERVASLVAIGHPADKVELLVLGGTWESYPESYRHEFIRDLYYAANTMYNVHDNNNSSSNTSVDGGAAKSQRALCTRAPLDLRQEQLLNETAACRIIGLTLETRPDTINHDLLVELRLLNCTRVQLGVQHTDDGILAGVHREATREDTMRAIKLLKDSCFKVDIHLMPDLPGSTPAADMNMFDDVLHSPDLQADQWKIYPCQTTPFTLIEQWYREGKYVPYGLENLVEVLLYAKTRVHPWIRLNRVIRDIPVDYVLAGVEVANLRQLLGVKLKEQGTSCRCIRCREVKGDRAVMAKLQSASICVREYAASGGTEIFISMETPDEATIFGFVRLRVDMRDVESPFDELRGCALIRELHVYGNLVTTLGEGFEDRAQHSGVGSSLLQRAEELAHARGYERVAVISGVGVRDYYRRKGYVLVHGEGICGDFLIKTLSSNSASSPSSSTVATATTAEAVATAPDAASGLLQRAWHHIRGLWGRSSKRAREE